jgi:hypothetical protein
MTDDSLNAHEIEEFCGYLRNCSDRQVQGVYDKEKAAFRQAYAQLAILEAQRRGLELQR